MLSVSGLQAAYGASQVLFDVTLEIAEGEVVTLLGRNGMGKTTTVRAVMGLLAPKGGKVDFEGRAIAGLPPERIARMGAGLVPEGRQVFPTLTVRENLVATAANRTGRANPWTLARVYELFPRLGERAGQMAARALMTNPRLLILDEATEGLAPVIRTEIWHVIERLKAEGQSILLIDKNLGVLKRLADRHFIIEKGRTVWSGTRDDLERDAATVQGYVGL